MSKPIKKFYRSSADRVIWGVCGGLGEYFGIDSTLIRILFIILSLGSGAGVLLYIILAIAAPVGPDGKISGPKKVKDLAEDLRSSARKISNQMNEDDKHHARNILGLIVLAVGTFMLLREAFHFYINWNLFYSFLIIILGLYLLDSYGRNKKQK